MRPAHPIRLDSGAAVTLVTEDGLLSELGVLIKNRTNADDRMGIDQSGSVHLVGGLVDGANVLVNNIEIGLIDFVNFDEFTIKFNNSATPDRVQELIHAFTYTSLKGSLDVPIQIGMYVADAGGRSTTATITINPADPIPPPPPPPTNERPTDISLSGATVLELASNGTEIGRLTAQDPDANDTLSFTLLDSAGGRFAIENGRLVVAAGIKLDFEHATSHRVSVRVTDKEGLTLDRAFTIAVGDVMNEFSAGTPADDNLMGGAGNDTFSGAAGVDWLVGGGGQDKLSGRPRPRCPDRWPRSRHLRFRHRRREEEERQYRQDHGLQCPR